MDNGIQSYAKAIAAGIMALAAVVAVVFGGELPEWLNEDWLLAIMAIVTPFLVAAIPNSR